MTVGIVSLVLAYVMSQFYRAFLAVMSPVLIHDLGVSAADLGNASGLWFLAFAVMQLPVGAALDRFGPRLTAGLLLMFGGAGGAALFAVAQAAWQINLAMALVGVGCAPVLVSGYYIFARVFSARMFGTLAGLMIGLGSLGNIASSLPLAFAVEAFGWRGTLWALAALTFVLAAGILLLVRDPERLGLTVKGSVLELLQMPAVWLILPIVAVNNLPIAGLRGLWVAPYLEQVFGLDATAIGKVTLAMGLAMVLGNLAYGPLDRLFGTRKWLIFAGNALMMFALVALCAWPARTLGFSTSMLAAVGFFGASFPMVMGHGRALFPPHLVGRGVTLLNFFGIGTIGVMQVATGQLYSRMQGTQAEEIIFPVIFAIYAILIAVALVVYLFAQDRTD